MTTEHGSASVVGVPPPGRTGAVWPDHVGVGGISRSAAAASDDERSGIAARDAVAAWDRRAATFPYPAVLAHLRAVGRGAASAALVDELRRLRPAPGTDTDPAVRRLGRWLRAATDQLDGDYHTYAVTDLHDDVLATSARTADLFVLAYLVDLLGVEASALAAAPSPAQRRRTNAVVQAVHRAADVAPAAASSAPDTTAPVRAIRSGAPDHAVASAALAVATVPAELRDVVPLSLMPVTPLHDEQMFLRIIQAFECVYRQVGWRLTAAAEALADRDPARAVRLLTLVRGRFAATSALYRVLTTMPPESFAVVRRHTVGRSAVQSRSYRRIQRAASGPGEPSVQEALRSNASALAAADRDAVVAAMRQVEAGWLAMKRTHWGITVKTIGTAPGTGGTSGADYLRATLGQPLFPALADGGPA
ncbi:MAG TPA: hypothetical protein VGN37_20940 [Actinocatenispora sp.]